MRAPKLLLPAPEGTLLRRMALLLRETVEGEVLVVLGRDAALHRRALLGLKGVRLRVAPGWRLGLAESLKLGLSALPEGPVLVLPGDQGGVGPEELKALVNAFREPGVLAGLMGEVISPAILGTRAREEATKLQGDRGAKGLLLALGAGIVALPPGPWNLDVDTWDDYRRLVEVQGWAFPYPPLPPKGPPYPALLQRAPLWHLGPATLLYGRPGAYEGLLFAENDALRLLARGAATLFKQGF
jgi:CTP:molybdopterin cytidylyltransferase MocA